jgi:hypothetical protein
MISGKARPEIALKKIGEILEKLRLPLRWKRRQAMFPIDLHRYSSSEHPQFRRHVFHRIVDWVAGWADALVRGPTPWSAFCVAYHRQPPNAGTVLG